MISAAYVSNYLARLQHSCARVRKGQTELLPAKRTITEVGIIGRALHPTRDAVASMNAATAMDVHRCIVSLLTLALAVIDRHVPWPTPVPLDIQVVEDDINVIAENLL